MKKFILIFSIIYFSGCSNPEKQANKNSMEQKIFNSNVNSFQTKFIKGFENEDHSLIMSLFADSVKWTGPDKKLLSQSSSYDEVSNAVKGYLDLYEKSFFSKMKMAQVEIHLDTMPKHLHHQMV